ncbi:MAG: formyltransferase family protein, partial [Nanoarchaeota archaeon]|nr:formyltransferase family protein [Nanoarchaeota archaeon]
AYAGYMSKASKILVESYTGVNVHPADLRLRKKGKPLYTGTHAVRKALQTGEKELRSTTHFVSEAVDCGQIFIVSAPLPVDYSEVEKIGIEQAASIYQNRLKEHGDWKIFPKTLKALAQGRFCIDFSGNLYYDGRPVPDGIEYH